MSFYNQPYFQQQQRRAHPAFAHPSPAPAFNFYTAPSPAPAQPAYSHPFATHTTDYEAEERAALAHLQAIQHRRRLAEAAELEREQSLRQREYEIEVAKRRHEAVQRQREAEVRALIEREVQKQRERAILAERQRVQAVIERERERARRQAYIEDVQRAREQKSVQLKQDRWARCVERCARRVEKKEDTGAEDLYKFMRLLGINLGEPSEEKVEEKKVDTPKATEAASSHTDTTPTFPDNINALLNRYLGLDVVPVNNETPAVPSSSDNKVPEGLNEFLSRFGLEFQPLDNEKQTKEVKVEKKEEKAQEVTPAPAAPAVSSAIDPPTVSATTPAPVEAPVAGPSTSSKKSPYELNDFLSRFGCEIDSSTFEKFFQGDNEAPIKRTPSTSTAETHTPSGTTTAQAEAPLTSYLNQVADVPPFVRDILSNVELAFAESAKKANDQPKPEPAYEGKGKGVAPGEKSTPAKPAKPEVTPLAKLDDIAHDLYLTTESFTFPPILSFSAQSDTTTPQLLFNKTNSSYHAQAHKLLQLLLAADGISSGGDKEVRSKRKEIVKRVEGAIEELERRRDDIWRKVQEGEIQQEVVDSRSSSETGSVAGDREEVEHVEHAEVEDAAKGFEVPAPLNEAQPDAEQPTEENVIAKKDQEEEKVDEDDDKKSVTIEEVPDKEDGYELL